ncbi:MAG: hypothetical protein SFX19_06500 [Alphaproteobacteria bacterium]|nr:hypothetical protein [Alphaproteobacteria bacterium]
MQAKIKLEHISVWGNDIIAMLVVTCVSVIGSFLLYRRCRRNYVYYL